MCLGICLCYGAPSCHHLYTPRHIAISFVGYMCLVETTQCRMRRCCAGVSRIVRLFGTVSRSSGGPNIRESDKAAARLQVRGRNASDSRQLFRDCCAKLVKPSFHAWANSLQGGLGATVQCERIGCRDYLRGHHSFPSPRLAHNPRPVHKRANLCAYL